MGEGRSYSPAVYPVRVRPSTPPPPPPPPPPPSSPPPPPPPLPFLSATSCCQEIALFDSPTCAYEKRAWTRIERMLAFCLMPRCRFLYLGLTPVATLVAQNPDVFSFPATGDGDGSRSIEMRLSDPLEEEARIEDDPVRKTGEGEGLSLGPHAHPHTPFCTPTHTHTR